MTVGLGVDRALEKFAVAFGVVFWAWNFVWSAATPAFAALPPAQYILYGVWLLPNSLRDSEADVNFGIMVSTQCRYACFAMRAGNKLAWEESAQIDMPSL